MLRDQVAREGRVAACLVASPCWVELMSRRLRENAKTLDRHAVHANGGLLLDDPDAA